MSSIKTYTGVIFDPVYPESERIDILDIANALSVLCRANGAEAYTYLGAANDVQNQRSRPMNLTWRLDRPTPARFLKKTNKLVV